ncbi:hypothetical protein Hanom_Chr10g00926431 [Helianthus anomalus]
MNQFEGRVTISIGEAKSLAQLFVSNNRFSGELLAHMIHLHPRLHYINEGMQVRSESPSLRQRMQYLRLKIYNRMSKVLTIF